MEPNKNSHSEPGFNRAAEKPPVDAGRDFDVVNGSEDPNEQEHEELHLEHRPPELVPGGIVYQEPVEQIIREELDADARKAIEEAHHRFQAGETEREEYVPTEADLTELHRYAAEADQAAGYEQSPEDDQEFDRRLRNRRNTREREIDQDR